MLICGCVCTATTLFQYANGICCYCFSNVTDTALKSVHVHIQFLIDLSNHIKYAKTTHLINENRKLGSVAGPVIQANGRLTFEDYLRPGGLLYFTTQ